MKRDLLTSILALVLLATSLAAAASAYKFLRTSEQNRSLQSIVTQVTQRRGVFNGFVIELNEYSIRNPALAPTLEKMNLRLRLTTNSVAKPQ